MSAQSQPQHAYDRIPYLIVFQEKSAFKDTYAGRMDVVGLEAHLPAFWWVAPILGLLGVAMFAVGTSFTRDWRGSRTT